MSVYRLRLRGIHTLIRERCFISFNNSKNLLLKTCNGIPISRNKKELKKCTVDICKNTNYSTTNLKTEDDEIREIERMLEQIPSSEQTERNSGQTERNDEQTERNDHKSEFLIMTEQNENKKIGDVIEISTNEYGIVLQVNETNIILGNIKKGTFETQLEKNNNIFTPYTCIEYLFNNYKNRIEKKKQKNDSHNFNLFKIVIKDIYRKCTTRQLYTNILLIDIFHKINYGQKVCFVGGNNKENEKIIASLIHENLLLNSLKPKEHLFIICSVNEWINISNLLHSLRELFERTYKHLIESKEKTKDLLNKIYSKGFRYNNNIEVPDDVIVLNSTLRKDLKMAAYVLPFLSINMLENYKKMYKNVILIFYGISNYSKIVLDLQNDMNDLVKNYFRGYKSNKWEMPIASLPYQFHSVLSKFFATSMYPLQLENEEEKEKKRENGEGHELEYQRGKRENGEGHELEYQREKKEKREKGEKAKTEINERIEKINMKTDDYLFENVKYTDLINLYKYQGKGKGAIKVEDNKLKSVTNLCFFDEEDDISQCKAYALSLSENTIQFVQTQSTICSEININHLIKDVRTEKNYMWNLIKEEIKNVFEKRQELMALIKNKEMMNIFVDHWEYEDLIHYNNVYYILIYKNVKTFNINSFELFVFLRNLFNQNFTNKNVSISFIELFYDQFFQFYFNNFHYFSFLYSEFYKNYDKYKDEEYARQFIHKIDDMLKNIQPPFSVRLKSIMCY